MRMRPACLILTVLAALALLPTAAPAASALGPGASGRRVAALQGYLAALHYLPWNAINGAYDYRTTQAVMAFEGWSGFSRDGAASVAVLRRLKHAKPPRGWSQYHGKRVEVHVTQQVLLLIGSDSRVVRAIHVSTGANGRTPLGSYSIIRKELVSWSIAFGVALPYASYFYSGFALHQYPVVPGYPASHGCVRMPAPEAPFVYAFATMGTPVEVR